LSYARLLNCVLRIRILQVIIGAEKLSGDQPKSVPSGLTQLK